MTIHVPEARIRRDTAAADMIEAIRTGRGQGRAWIALLVAEAELAPDDTDAAVKPFQVPAPQPSPTRSRRHVAGAVAALALAALAFAISLFH